MKSFDQQFSVTLPTSDLPVRRSNKEKAEKNIIMKAAAVEAEFLLQWGNRKRLRCGRARGGLHNTNTNTNTNTNNNKASSARTRRKLNSRFLTASRHTGNTEAEAEARRSEDRRSLSRSPEKEERYYPTRGSTMEEENGGGGKIVVDVGAVKGNNKSEDYHYHQQQIISNVVKKPALWPRLCIALSSKEKEEDFFAMKGCKLPQRPKKRAKLVQRSLLLVSPGAWLTDMSLERYEVREKKSSKRKARGGLKAMGSVESDSE